MGEDTYDDIDDAYEQFVTGILKSFLSKEEKIQIRSKYNSSLIIKLMGKSTQYHYLIQKPKSLWKPTGEMDCILLGRGFYLLKFSNIEDFNLVLKNSHWFINGQFLSVRLWEPMFSPEKANLSIVVVWIRLPNLSMEFFDSKNLV